MRDYLGDILSQQTIYFHFLTEVAGTPTTLAGSPAIKIYKDDSTSTETATGVTLVTDFDSVTGLNSVKIVTTDAFYTTGHDYSVIITAGTIGAIPAAGYVVGYFSIENRNGNILSRLGAPVGASVSADIATLQSTVSNISITGSPSYVAPSSYVLTTGNQTSGTYSNVDTSNGVYHVHTDTAGVLSLYYEYTLRSDQQAVNLTFKGRITSSNDSMTVEAYDWIAAAFVPLFTLAGVNTTTDTNQSIPLVGKYTGTGANIGKVRIRFVNAVALTTATLYVDLCIVGITNTSRTVGYSNGSVWVKSTGNSGTENYTNGTADNPCPWADALVIAASLGLTNFRILNGEIVTLTGACNQKSLIGEEWNLALGGQSISASYFKGASVSGIASAASRPTFEDCHFVGGTYPPMDAIQCGFNTTSGAPFVAASAGQYLFVDCFSQVAGSGTPYFTFSGTGGTTGVNIRSWSGGSNSTLDSNVTMSLEVLAGGGQTITTGGGSAELRGVFRAATIVLSGSPTVQIAAVTGTITLSGAATSATVNIWGVHGVVTNTSTGSTVNIKGVSQDTVADSVWDEVLTGSTHNIATSVGRRLRQLGASVILEVTVVSATSSTITFNGDAATTDGAYDPAAITIIDGTGVGQTRLILDYVGSTKTAYVDRDWKTVPTAGAIAVITAHPGREHVNEGRAQGGTENTITLNPLASDSDDVYIGQVVFIRAGTGQDQACRVIDYDGTSKIATVCRDWWVIPDATSVYTMLPTGILDMARFIDDIWANDSRTLTTTTATVTGAVSGSSVSIQRGDNIAILITGLGSITDRTKLRLTAKTDKTLPDSAALVQIEETAGLDVLNGQAVTGASKASADITVTDAALGNISVTMKSSATALLPILTGAYYDVQKSVSTEAYTLTEGAFTVLGDVTVTI